jgi:hypothetical protein
MASFALTHFILNNGQLKVAGLSAVKVKLQAAEKNTMVT